MNTTEDKCELQQYFLFNQSFGIKLMFLKTLITFFLQFQNIISLLTVTNADLSIKLRSISDRQCYQLHVSPTCVYNYKTLFKLYKNATYNQ